MKKFGVVVLAAALCAVMLAGCAVSVPEPTATEPPSASPSPSESASVSPSPSVSAEPTTQVSAAAEDTDYMSWTGEQWDAATEAEKMDAAYAVLGKAGDKIIGESFTTLMELAKTDEKAKQDLEEGAKSLIVSIDAFFETMPSATLSQLVEAMEAVVNKTQD